MVYPYSLGVTISDLHPHQTEADSPRACLAALDSIPFLFTLRGAQKCNQPTSQPFRCLTSINKHP